MHSQGGCFALAGLPVSLGDSHPSATPSSCLRNCTSSIYIAPRSDRSHSCICSANLPSLRTMRLTSTQCNSTCLDGSICGGVSSNSGLVAWTLYTQSLDASLASSIEAQVNDEMPLVGIVPLVPFGIQGETNATTAATGDMRLSPGTIVLVGLISVLFITALVVAALFAFVARRSLRRDWNYPSMLVQHERKSKQVVGGVSHTLVPTFPRRDSRSGLETSLPSPVPQVLPAPFETVQFESTLAETIPSMPVSSSVGEPSTAFETSLSNSLQSVFATISRTATAPLQKFQASLSRSSPLPTASLPRSATPTTAKSSEPIDASYPAIPDKHSFNNSFKSYGLLLGHASSSEAMLPTILVTQEEPGSFNTGSLLKQGVLGAMPVSLVHDLNHFAESNPAEKTRKTVWKPASSSPPSQQSAGNYLIPPRSDSMFLVSSPTDTVQLRSVNAQKKTASSIFMETLAINTAMDAQEAGRS
ncbi:hypothetical protein BJ741DRAFT_663102 [Chytriomyces cf. hyalinus JEL632]|nr:hypothetical protein BJ741DRAFT_663102 [Chytriomyces cf. hyalinus JEL632]